MFTNASRNVIKVPVIHAKLKSFRNAIVDKKKERHSVEVKGFSVERDVENHSDVVLIFVRKYVTKEFASLAN